VTPTGDLGTGYLRGEFRALGVDLETRRRTVDERLEHIAALEALGATRVVSTCCGDDPIAAEDTVRAFGEQVVARV
jgi:hypothetical protein